MQALLIQNATLCSAGHTAERRDLLIQDGKIADIAPHIDAPEAEGVDASGLTVAPGLVDLHVHLRDPGFTEKEDILTGCSAAAAGGITSVFAMPNTSPATDSVETVHYIKDKAANANARVYPVAAITKGLQGEHLTDMEALVYAGAAAFSDDGVPVKTAALMAQAMAQAARLQVPIFAHCEDKSLASDGIIHAGRVASMLGVHGIPHAAEDVGTAREIALLMTAPAGTHLHICHVSSRYSVELIRAAKKQGLHITAETAPHYFMMTEEKLLMKDADYRMNPPLREEADRTAVLEAVLDGTIDAIATDHAPHTPEQKADFLKAPNGVVGMETSFSASYTALVKTGLLTTDELIRRMSENPCSIAGIEGGELRVGAPADLFLFDESERWTVDTEKLHGKSKNCIYKGEELYSKVKMTVLGGKTVYSII